MKKINILIFLIFILSFSFIGYRNKNNIIKSEENINKTVNSSVAINNTKDTNPYIQLLGYNKINDNIIWQVKFLQNTNKIGDVFICVLLYDENGNPVKNHKDGIINIGTDRLFLVEGKEYPINEKYNFDGDYDIFTNYSKIKYCIQSVYYLNNNGKWQEWENPNLNNWINANKNKY